MNNLNRQTQCKIGYRKETCDKFDWRIKGLGTLETELKRIPEDNNTYDWEEGSIFFLTQPFLFNGNKLDLVIPEMTALYLNIANKNFISSREILVNLKKDKTKGYIHLESESFDLIEDIAVSVVFSISALEVFFNQLLLNKDRNAPFLTEKKKNGETRNLKIDDIEWLLIETKYIEVLPIMFDLKNPNLEKITSKLKFLNKLRNDIIHLKSKDLQPHTDITKQSTIWKRIFDQSKNNPAVIATEIIKFFYEESGLELPRFLRLLPFKK